MHFGNLPCKQKREKESFKNLEVIIDMPQQVLDGLS